MYTKILCVFLFLWVWAVSMLDHYLTIKLSETIATAEKNPIGLYLLRLDEGNPALFMTIKMMCLWIIFLICLKLYQWKPRNCLAALICLSLAQLFLVFYFFYEPQF